MTISALTVREKFEAWFLEKYPTKNPITAIEKRGNSYLALHANVSWLAWQAAFTAGQNEAARECERLCAADVQYCCGEPYRNGSEPPECCGNPSERESTIAECLEKIRSTYPSAFGEKK